MRLPLASIADHRDRLAFQGSRVDIRVVDERRHEAGAPICGWVVGRGSGRGGGHRNRPGAHEAAQPQAAQQPERLLNAIRAGEEAQLPGCAPGVEQLAPGQVDGLPHRRTVRGVGRSREGDQRQLQLDAGHVGEVIDLDDLDEPLELGQHLVEVPVVAVDHDGHPRAPGLVGGGDRERIDVERAGAQQAGDPVQGPRAVDDDGAHDVPFRRRLGEGLARLHGGCHADPPSSISERPFPGSIMG